MVIDHQRSLGMYIDAFGFDFLWHPPFHHDRQIQGDSPQWMIDDLVCLSGFHPQERTASHVGVHIGLKVASRYPPLNRERQGQETGMTEEDIVCGYFVLDKVEGHSDDTLRTEPDGVEG